MLCKIEENSGVSAYMQLYAQLRAAIVAGEYPYAARMPSKRWLSQETGVSLSTAEHAYALLCEEGYVEARQRSGYYAAFRPDGGFAAGAVAARRIARHTDASAPTDFPFSVLARTMRSVLSIYGEQLLQRAPSGGCDVLREALARYLQRRCGISARPGQIIIGSGAEYLYAQIVRMLGRGRIYALEDPSYEKIAQVYQAEGVQCEMLPLTQDGIDSAALQETGASVLHVTPYRSFPSGVTASASKRHEYVRWAAQGDRYLVEDDFESEFSVSGKPEETLFALDDTRVIYLNTFSKTISPALRVGYMVLPEALTALYAQRVGFYSCTVPVFEQYVLAELIENGDFERNINRIRRRKRQQMSK